MNRKKILITGANGFVGQALLRRLAEAGYELYGLGMQNSLPHMRLYYTKFFVQDITCPFVIDENFEVVFHLAALNLTHIGQKNNKLYEAVNIEGTKNVITAVNTEKFVFMSSSHIYSSQKGKINEMASVNPRTDYAKSKLKGEIICRKYFNMQDVIIVRPVNIIGPGQPLKAAVPLFIHNAIKGIPIEVFTSRKTKLQLLYLDDVIEFFINILGKKALSGVFNLAPQGGIEMDRLVGQIITLTHSDSLVNYSNNDTPMQFDISSQKASELLQWRPQTDVLQMLKNILLMVK